MGIENHLLRSNGDYAMSFTNIGGKSYFRQIVTDAFTTLIDSKWRWTILVFALGHFVTWTGFAVAYFLLWDTCTSNQRSQGSSGCTCIDNVGSFTTALLFSVETQHTIGYGFRTVGEDCPHVIGLVFCQFIAGIAIQCLTVGTMLSKLFRAKGRRKTILFSSSVCIGLVEGERRLMVRIGDLHADGVIGTKVVGLLVKRKLKYPSPKRAGRKKSSVISSIDSQEYYLETSCIDFSTEGGSRDVSLLWPMVLHHKIQESNFLLTANESQPLGEHLELIIIVEGLVEWSGVVIQARASYGPKDVLVGKRFKDMDLKALTKRSVVVDCSDFDTTIPCVF